MKNNNKKQITKTTLQGKTLSKVVDEEKSSNKNCFEKTIKNSRLKIKDSKLGKSITKIMQEYSSNDKIPPIKLNEINRKKGKIHHSKKNMAFCNPRPNKPFFVGYKNHGDHYKIHFWIGVQGFTLDYEAENEETAKWMANNLKIAFETMMTNTLVRTSKLIEKEIFSIKNKKSLRSSK